MFRDRTDAGRRLADRLRALGWQADLVLGVPRGGVLVASPVAKALCAPLNVAVVRKISHPSHREFGVGAVAEDGSFWLDPEWAERAGMVGGRLEETLARLRGEMETSVAMYRRILPPPCVKGRCVVLVDDGAATGGTLAALCLALRSAGPARLVVALPVASDSAAMTLRSVADDLEVLHLPPDFRAVGEWYENFGQISDAEAIACLREEGANP